MRIHFPDLVRPKQAAKYLARASTRLKLATVHEELARVLGYRDWHELAIASHPNGVAAPDRPDLDGAVLTILALADASAFRTGMSSMPCRERACSKRHHGRSMSKWSCAHPSGGGAFLGLRAAANLELS